MKTVEGVGLTWGGLETTKELNNDLSHDMSDMFAKRNYFCPAKSKNFFTGNYDRTRKLLSDSG